MYLFCMLIYDDFVYQSITFSSTMDIEHYTEQMPSFFAFLSFILSANKHHLQASLHAHGDVIVRLIISFV